MQLNLRVSRSVFRHQSSGQLKKLIQAELVDLKCSATAEPTDQKKNKYIFNNQAFISIVIWHTISSYNSNDVLITEVIMRRQKRLEKMVGIIPKHLLQTPLRQHSQKIDYKCQRTGYCRAIECSYLYANVPTLCKLQTKSKNIYDTGMCRKENHKGWSPTTQSSRVRTVTPLNSCPKLAEEKGNGKNWTSCHHLQSQFWILNVQR